MCQGVGASLKRGEVTLGERRTRSPNFPLQLGDDEVDRLVVDATARVDQVLHPLNDPSIHDTPCELRGCGPRARTSAIVWSGLEPDRDPQELSPHGGLRFVIRDWREQATEPATR